ncbi:hypothetical protein [Streptomyces sp. NPDC017993]|uniref:hypothetical protein n=1 Tax=Streptomyces sp. NPDC017993 TaxID=3365027 RepID=UPI0037939507
MDRPSPGLAHQRAFYRLHTVLERAAEAAGADVDVFERINVVVPESRSPFR